MNDVSSSLWLLIGLLVLLVAPPCQAARLASKGKLSVPSSTKVLVVSTDPVVQQVLSEDFAAARRSKTIGGPTMLTLTVSITERVLRPDVPIMELAPGVPEVANLLKEAGYSPPSTAGAATRQLTGDAAEYMQYGNPAAAYQSNSQNGPNDSMARYELYQLSGYSPGPPTPQDPYDPRNRAAPAPDYLEPQASRLFDTALIAHAVLSDGKGEMSVVAIAHPGEDLQAVKKELAERIANAVLH